MVPTPPHYSIAHISKRPRQKATTDSDRTRNSKNFIGDRILAPRHRFGTGTKKRVCSFLTSKRHSHADFHQQQETGQHSPSTTSPTNPFQTFRKAVKERPRHTHSTASPNFEVAQLRNGRSDLDEIFHGVPYFLTANTMASTASSACQPFRTGCGYRRKKIRQK